MIWTGRLNGLTCWSRGRGGLSEQKHWFVVSGPPWGARSGWRSGGGGRRERERERWCRELTHHAVINAAGPGLLMWRSEVTGAAIAHYSRQYRRPRPRPRPGPIIGWPPLQGRDMTRSAAPDAAGDNAHRDGTVSQPATASPQAGVR